MGILGLGLEIFKDWSQGYSRTMVRARVFSAKTKGILGQGPGIFKDYS